MRTILLLFLLFVPLLIPTLANAWPATVVSISDGDTVIVAPAGDTTTPISVRLYGIDAPESDQDGGKSATEALKVLLPVDAMTEIIPFDTDKYGRIVALIIYQGHTINAQMLTQGHAWVYAQYCRARFCKEWRKLEKAAQQNNMGLWQDADAISPWEWRKKD